MSQNQSEETPISLDLIALQEEKQFIIHVSMKGERELSIRPETFLMCNKPHRKAFLLFGFGAPIYPQTSYGVDQAFTLIFGGLEKGCSKFNFIEGKLHAGMFLAQDILRNEEDVYHLTFGD